jgi:hypothetical protein
MVQAGVLPAHAQSTLCAYEIHYDESGIVPDTQERFFVEIFGSPEWNELPSVSATCGGLPVQSLVTEWLPPGGPPYNGATIYFYRSPGADGYLLEVCFIFSDTCSACTSADLSPVD